MKLLFFDDFKLGVLKGEDIVVDVSSVVADIPHFHPQDTMAGLIENFDDYRGRLEEAVRTGSGVPLSGVRVRPPLPRPSTITCMAVNYMEDSTRDAVPPMNAFHKSPHSIIGDGDTMVLPDAPGKVFEGEAEIAVVIGKKATNVSQQDAISYVFGYVNFIDGSARGLPPEGNTFYQMKSRDTFAPIGPFLVTKDEVPEPQNLKIQLWNNGQLRQNFNTSDMAHSIPECIEWITSIHSLSPGDILATGTNHRGLHAFQDGDFVELEVAGLGRLHVRVEDELKRTWSRETRLDRHNLGEKQTQAPQLSGKYATT